MGQLARIDGATPIWTPRQLATIQATVAKGTNSDEFNLFIEYAKVKGLDPFSRQVIAIIFSKDNAEKRQMTIVTTQDGLRVMAARCGDYRPEETEPTYEYDPELKGPTNPLGIVKCTVTLWKQDQKTSAWHPVNGTAYWSEYAPIKRDAEGGYDWEDTGETWPDTGKPKKRKVARGAVTEVLDDSGMWKKMPRNQIAKCARAHALRGGWPLTFSGVYAEEELDKAKILDLTASEIVEQEQADRRAKAIAMSSDEYPWINDSGVLVFVPAGRFCDHALSLVRNYTKRSEYDDMMIRNREGFVRFWAKHKDDCLELRKQIDDIAGKLQKEAA